MSNVYFTFGPGDSFVFSGPKRWQFRGRHSIKWEKEVCDAEAKLQQIYCYATDEDFNTFGVWIDQKNVRKWYATSGTSKYKDFHKFVQDNGESTRAVIGTNTQFIAWSISSKACRWSLNEPSWALKTCREIILEQNRRFKCASLGVDETAFLMTTDDRWCYSLKTHYTTLQGILADLRNGDIEYLTLNPFRVEQFFLLRADGVAIFRVSFSLRDELLDLLEKHGIKCQDLSSQRADKPPPSLPAATRESSFLKGITRDVTVQGFGAIVGGVVSGIVGAAACTVM